MRDQASEKSAETAAEYLRRECSAGMDDPEVGIVLGTGWGGALAIKQQIRVSLEKIPGFHPLRQLDGHARAFICGDIGGRKVVALSGRVHMNEAPADRGLAENVRLQIEMLLRLGVKTLILTSAVGSLNAQIHVGDIVVVDGFVTVFAPEMPLYAGEFCSPEDALDLNLRKLALEVVRGVTSKATEGGLAVVRGPYFEGRKYDKAFIAASGASIVGMSILPEACVAALYPGVRVLALSFVTNSAFEEHSHESNQLVAQRNQTVMGQILTGILRRL